MEENRDLGKKGERHNLRYMNKRLVDEAIVIQQDKRVSNSKKRSLLKKSMSKWDLGMSW